MIRKISILTICLLYLVTASGFALNLHYCLGSVRSVTINAPAQPCSSKKMSMKCCKDKRVEVKVKDAHQAEAPSLLSKIFQVDLPKLPFEYMLEALKQPEPEKPVQRGPPPPNGSTPVFLKNCTLRI